MRDTKSRAPGMREASPLDELAEAARDHRLISFEYESDGERSSRRVEPYRMVLHKSRLYLLTWDVERHDWRTFRIDRMSGLERGESFEAREIPGDAAAIHQDDATPPVRATLVFDAPVGSVADRLRTQEAEFASLEPDRARTWLWVASYEWLAAVVLSMGIDFTIEEPDEFREHCAALRDRLDRAVHG